MDKIIIITGIIVSIFSLLIILFSKQTKNVHNTKIDGNFNDLELEFRDLKNQIIDLTREFNRTANFNTNLLDEKTVYLNEVREDVDEKIMKLNKLITDSEIISRRLEKRNNKSEIINNVSIKENEQKIIKLKPQKKEKNNFSTNNIIFEYFQKGYSLSEISDKTEKSIGEIEFIIGLQKLR